MREKKTSKRQNFTFLSRHFQSPVPARWENTEVEKKNITMKVKFGVQDSKLWCKHNEILRKSRKKRNIMQYKYSTGESVKKKNDIQKMRDRESKGYKKHLYIYRTEIIDSVDKVQWSGVMMGNLLCARQEAAQRRQAPAAAFIGNHTSTCRTGAAGPSPGQACRRYASTYSTSTPNEIHPDWCVWSSASALTRDAHPAHRLVSVSAYRLRTLTATTWKCVLQTCVLAEYLPSLFVVVVADNLCAMLSGDGKNVEWTSEDATLARTTDRPVSSPALTKHSTRQNDKTTGASELKRSAERKTQPHLQEYTTRKYLAVWHTKQSVVFTVDRRWWMMSSGSFRWTK